MGIEKVEREGLAAAPRPAGEPSLLPPEVGEHDAEDSYHGDPHANTRRSK